MNYGDDVYKRMKWQPLDSSASCTKNYSLNYPECSNPSNHIRPSFLDYSQTLAREVEVGLDLGDGRAIALVEANRACIRVTACEIERSRAARDL